MLRMKSLSNAKKAEAYYAVSDAGYYAGHDGLKSEWGGKDAARLGLISTPESDQFKNLLHGLDPHTGSQLTAKLIDGRIAGWDVTASVPKRVTLALERGDRRIQEAIWQATREAMAMLEEYATTRVRVKGKQEDRRTGNLVWYAIEHAETRPTIDPSLPEDHKWHEMPLPDRHIHCVVPNLTFDEAEGKWKAVKFRPIMDIRRFFDRSFDTILAGKLSALGYALETSWKRDGRYHSWDIQGIPQEVADRFSRRTQEVAAAEAEILATQERVHGAAPEQLPAVIRDKLGATSRRLKRDDLTLAECREYWNSLLSDEEAATIDQMIQNAVIGSNPKPKRLAEEALDFAIRHQSEWNAAFRWEELAATAMEHSMGAALPDEIRLAAEKLGVIFREKEGRMMCTTRELQCEEDLIINFASHARGTKVPVGVPKELKQGVLSDEQWGVVQSLLSTSNGVNVVDAAAGTGKTTLLKTFNQGMELAGKQVHYLGTTSDSVEILRSDGFDAKTVAHFLLSKKDQEAARGGWLVVDEVSMLGHKDALRLSTIAHENNLRLLLVGDSRQHRSVNRGDIMRLMREYAGIRHLTLNEIRRQRENPDYLEAVKLMSRGEVAAGFDALDGKGFVKEITDGSERVAAMAEDYLRAVTEGKSMLVVSPTHAESSLITAEIRSRLREVGRIRGPERIFARLVAAHASEAERGLRTTYHDGDVIQFMQNAAGFKKGQRILVNGPASVPVALADRFQLYHTEPISLAVGDRIRFTSTVTTQSGKKLRNGATHTVAEFTLGGNIRLNNGEIVDADAGHFRHGLVDTTFSSQGKTTQRVILGMASQSLPAINLEALYVGASRAKEYIRLYTDDKAAVREAGEEHTARVFASDLRNKPTLQDRIRKHNERLRRYARYKKMVEEWDAEADPTVRGLVERHGRGR